MFVFIDGVDRTKNVKRNTITIFDELQERMNTCRFVSFGFIPEELKEVKIYSGFFIESATVNTIILQKEYDEAVQNNIFRVGLKITVRINESTEQIRTISNIDNNNGLLRLTVSENFTSTPIKDEKCGIKVFAGNIHSIRDRNIRTLNNIEYGITVLDYTKIFDKQLVNDTYENRDGRYIINDFCNNFINNNSVIDQLNYANNTAIQVVWIEGGTGSNPLTDSNNPFETDHWGVFPSASGSASFEASLPTVDGSSFVGVTSGTPTKGELGFWIKVDDVSLLSSIQIKIGNDSSNYFISSDFSSLISEDNKEVYVDLNLKDFTETGSVDWQNIDFLRLEITSTGTINTSLAGIRFLEDEFFRHYPFCQTSTQFDDFKVPRKKPTETMQIISDTLGWYWYIDYDKNIHFFPQEQNAAPFEITETSNNFLNLSIKVDTSRLLNRQVVEGGTETSISKYNQVVEGDGFVREWILKNKFKNLIVKLNDGISTDVMEAGTDATTVKATAHGLSVDDYIVNRSRQNAVRKVLTVPDTDTFTVESVTGQIPGDSFSLFVQQNVGVEGIGDETINDYMSNFNEKSIRNAADNATLNTGDFLLFNYNEVNPILVQTSDNVSIDSMINILGYSNGVFDGQKIINKTLQTRIEARNIANAEIKKYSNPIITATFDTTQEGLLSGQLIRIKDTANGTRNINQEFVIQRVKLTQAAWGENVYKITCSSLLFGMLELLQQLLRKDRELDVEEDAVIDNIENAFETLTISDNVTFEVDGNKQQETLTISDNVITKVFIPPFKYGPDPDQAIYNLSSYG